MALTNWCNRGDMIDKIFVAIAMHSQSRGAQQTCRHTDTPAALRTSSLTTVSASKEAWEPSDVDARSLLL